MANYNHNYMYMYNKNINTKGFLQVWTLDGSPVHVYNYQENQ